MNILIYNPAAINSGALSVLQSFINDIANYPDHNFFVITSANINIGSCQNGNVFIIRSHNDYYTRLKWNLWKLNKVCSKYEIDVILSLQNTIESRTKVPAYVYIHNILPLVVWEYKKLLNTGLRIKMIILKNLIRKTVKRAKKIFVQTYSFKNKLIESFKISEDNIIVNYPNCETWESDSCKVSPLVSDIINKIKRKGYYCGVYIAADLPYKNHTVLAKFCRHWNENHEKKVVLIFTTNNNGEVANKCKMLGIQDSINFIGSHNKDTVMYLYEQADVVFFSSFIESYPFPLKEALNKGKKIITADTDFAREICGDRAFYFDTFDFINLAKCFEDALKKPNPNITSQGTNCSFIDIIKTIENDFKNIK